MHVNVVILRNDTLFSEWEHISHHSHLKKTIHIIVWYMIIKGHFCGSLSGWSIVCCIFFPIRIQRYKWLEPLSICINVFQFTDTIIMTSGKKLMKIQNIGLSCMYCYLERFVWTWPSQPDTINYPVPDSVQLNPTQPYNPWGLWPNRTNPVGGCGFTKWDCQWFWNV